jgi:hypothetical protein
MSSQIIPLKGRSDSRPQPNSGHRDYSHLSCGVEQTQLGLRAGGSRQASDRAG